MLVGDEKMSTTCVCGCLAVDHAAAGSCDDCGACSMLEEMTQ